MKVLLEAESFGKLEAGPAGRLVADPASRLLADPAGRLVATPAGRLIGDGVEQGDVPLDRCFSGGELAKDCAEIFFLRTT